MIIFVLSCTGKKFTKQARQYFEKIEKTIQGAPEAHLSNDDKTCLVNQLDTIKPLGGEERVKKLFKLIMNRRLHQGVVDELTLPAKHSILVNLAIIPWEFSLGYDMILENLHNTAQDSVCKTLDDIIQQCKEIIRQESLPTPSQKGFTVNHQRLQHYKQQLKRLDKFFVFILKLDKEDSLFQKIKKLTKNPEQFRLFQEGLKNSILECVRAENHDNELDIFLDSYKGLITHYHQEISKNETILSILKEKMTSVLNRLAPDRTHAHQGREARAQYPGNPQFFEQPNASDSSFSSENSYDTSNADESTQSDDSHRGITEKLNDLFHRRRTH